ncbi:hypothetical protein KWH83_17850, partial [Morganella morganii]|uniref:3'-5' exonuclease n=1 Tax=Morganella morganii TaxID=582 RepID=UPI0021D1027D
RIDAPAPSGPASDVYKTPHAEEARLMYVALTRAKKQVWLLYDKDSPSCFAEELADMGVSRVKKP